MRIKQCPECGSTNIIYLNEVGCLCSDCDWDNMEKRDNSREEDSTIIGAPTLREMDGNLSSYVETGFVARRSWVWNNLVEDLTVEESCLEIDATPSDWETDVMEVAGGSCDWEPPPPCRSFIIF